MTRAPILYQETRISPTPYSPTSILTISTDPSTSNNNQSTRKRLFDQTTSLDEATYARKRLATDGTIFFRPTTRTPRSFLWRVLDDRKLLEVQCVDLVVNHHPTSSATSASKPDPSTASTTANGTSSSPQKEGWLTFHIPFHNRILRHGVACADGGVRDALELFVLTAGHELFTITLRRDLLQRETVPSAFDPTTCVKRFVPSSWSFRRPYRLLAVSALEVFVSLQDGGLMRLERKAGESGSAWRETFFSEGGWSGTIKSWNPFGKGGVVRFEGGELEGGACVGMVVCPKGEVVWTVGLDYVLKAWSVKSGKVVVQRDLLDDGSDGEERKKLPQMLMNAEQGTLLQVLTPDGSGESSAVVRKDSGKYWLAVYSPKDHRIRFYSVATTFSSVDGESIDVRDLYPATPLIPPFDDLMNTNMWHLENFAIAPGPQLQQSQIWIRARTGAHSSTFMLKFDILDDDAHSTEDTSVWQTGWTFIDDSSANTESMREVPEVTGSGDLGDTSVTVSEKWLKFLFYPGRFSDVCLETALHIYRNGRGLPATSRPINSAEQPLKERLTSAIAAKILLRRGTDEQPDYDRYQFDLQAQWNTFFSILSHLHNRRHESIGFSFDHDTGLAWSICADFVAPIRLNSRSENLFLNAQFVSDVEADRHHESIINEIFQSDEDTTTSRITAVARQFRQYFSPSSRERFQNAVIQLALDRDGEQTAKTALQTLYDSCGFGNEVSDDDFEALNENATYFDGLGSLADEHFFMVAESLEDGPKSRGIDQGQLLGRYGSKFSILVVQETLRRTRNTLLDLLALIVFMHGDLERDELDPNLRPEEVFEALTHRLMQVELRSWLTSNVRQSSQKPGQVADKQQEVTPCETLFESIFIGDWDPRADAKQTSLPELLTSWSKRLTFYLDLNRSWDDIAGHIMGDLIRYNNLELATDFSRFLTDASWHSYLRGRLQLALGDFSSASIEFRRAADDLAATKPESFMQGGLLFADESQLFGDGKAKYYKHIVALYEKVKAFSYTADYANLALESLEDKQLLSSIADIDDRKRRNVDSPAGEQIRYTMEEIKLLRMKETRDDILNRLFNALMQTSRFESAFTALEQITTPALQKACLHSLIHACITADAIPALLGLPLNHDLIQEADSILLNLAKKTLSSTSATPASTATSATPPHHQILFAFRIAHSDFRGAAAILHEHLERLRFASRFAVHDPDDERLVDMYALLISTLACCGAKDAWLLADPIPGVHPAGQKRKLVRLEDVRREYAAELDRRSDVALGRFPLLGNGGLEDDITMAGGF